MSKNYKQLSLEQRYQIEALLKAGMNQKSIASQLNVHPSTICREINRNVSKRGRAAGVYIARIAIGKTNNRHIQKPKRIIFTEEMKSLIVRYLEQDKWSPEYISKCVNGVEISHEWIYQWIWRCKHENKSKTKAFKKLYRYLKHGKRKRKRGNRYESRGTIPNRISIEKRPKIVTKRKRVGDIEVDLMMGKNHQGALLVMTDRATLQTRLKKLKSKSSKEVMNGIIENLNRNNYIAKTLTFDNDKAFSCHNDVSKIMNVRTYFTRPYTSQDKGTVENRIGVIRRFLSKKTNLNFVDDDIVMEIEEKINNRPVRKFNYLTPNQVLLNKIALIT